MPSHLKRETREILKKLDVPEEEFEGDMLDMAVGFLHAFKTMDKDNKNSLNKDDFNDLIQQLNPEERPEKFLALCDFNHDGIVTREEFIKAYVKLEISDKHYAAFADIDTDSDGRISLEELKIAFSGSKYENKVKKWFKAADTNKSGFISYREFCKSPLEKKYFKALDSKKEREELAKADGEAKKEVEDGEKK